MSRATPALPLRAPRAAANSARAALALALTLVAPGCGLLIDLDPPDDGGFDANVPAMDAAALDAPAHLDAPTHLDAPAARDASDLDGSAPDAPLADAGSDAGDPLACASADDCASFLDTCGERFACLAGHCEPPPPRCTEPPRGACESIDPCTCESRPDDARCTDPAAPRCDPGTFACVGCLDNTSCGAGARCDPLARVCVTGCLSSADCAASGGASRVCDPDTRACVQCLTDVDCRSGGSGPRCDVASHTCVPCLNDLDCRATPTSPVCDPSAHTCRGCRAVSDCGRAGVCDPTGACVAPACRVATDCPSVSCATSSCLSGRCTYVAIPGVCASPAACVEAGCAPTLAAADANGCVFAPIDLRCADAYGCSDDVCVGALGGPGVDARGCRHDPRDDRCGPATSSGRCAERVCVVGDPGVPAPPAPGDGCLDAFTRRCPDGSLCRPDGSCSTAPACGADRPCIDDGSPCNGAEICVGGRCTNGPSGVDACDGPSCSTVCVRGLPDSCATRTVTSCGP